LIQRQERHPALEKSMPLIPNGSVLFQMMCKKNSKGESPVTQVYLMEMVVIVV